MRLVCPNCDAQYDVPDDVIPDGGRDVQCSSCGHTWFEAGPLSDLGARTVMRPAPSSKHDPDSIANADTGVTHSVLPQISPIETETEDTPTPKRPKLDPNVADILREEAAYESRLREQETLEYQEEFPLDEPETNPETELDYTSDDALFENQVITPRTRSADTRKDVFPDIEEINSTLRSSASPRSTSGEQRPREQKKRNRVGFRIGFSFVLIFALIGLGFYVYAEDLKVQFPNGKGTIEAYVTWVDHKRQYIQMNVEAAVNWLKSQADTMSNGQTSE